MGDIPSKSFCCRECGRPLDTPRRGRQFCNSACRRHFNNRRAVRGADLYDVLMAIRFDRAHAQGALTLLCRMAADFRALDRRDREGRRSWVCLAEIGLRNSHLAARVVGLNIIGARRRGGVGNV